jgi:hypothetical protein
MEISYFAASLYTRVLGQTIPVGQITWCGQTKRLTSMLV